MTVEKLFFFPIPPGERKGRERGKREHCRTVEQDLAWKHIWSALHCGKTAFFLLKCCFGRGQSWPLYWEKGQPLPLNLKLHQEDPPWKISLINTISYYFSMFLVISCFTTLYQRKRGVARPQREERCPLCAVLLAPRPFRRRPRPFDERPFALPRPAERRPRPTNWTTTECLATTCGLGRVELAKMFR